MSKQKSIILFTIGNIDHPSSRIRGIQYIPWLEKAGYKVKWIPRIPPKPKTKFDKWIKFPLGKRWMGVKRIFAVFFLKPDLFFIQKIFISDVLLKVLKLRNIPFVFDFDDAIYLDKKNSGAKKRTIKIIKKASKVIVSSPVLVEFCQKYGVEPVFITTPVDVNRIKPLENKVIKEKFVIGWIGSFWTTKYLKIIEKPLRDLAKKYDFVLRLVGADTNFTIEDVEIEHVKWSFDKEAELLQSFDIGIMPLTDDEYSRAKGGYKLLMYMASGIPSIASPVGINKYIIKRGETGFLSETEGQWFNSFRFFIENKGKAEEFGKLSRKIAVQEFSREVCFEKLLNTLESLN